MDETKWSFEANGAYKRVLEHCRKANESQAQFEEPHPFAKLCFERVPRTLMLRMGAKFNAKFNAKD